MLSPDGSFKPQGFYSAHLTDTQKKYSVFKKELLGAFKSLRHFLPDVYGKHLTIYTDHLPLKNIFHAPSDKIPLNDLKEGVPRLLHMFKKAFFFYKYTRGPWTATPALIKVEERGQN